MSSAALQRLTAAAVQYEDLAEHCKSDLDVLEILADWAEEQGVKKMTLFVGW